ncbi:hypothetical protein ACS0TY_033860 [Phlomoides rotata]
MSTYASGGTTSYADASRPNPPRVVHNMVLDAMKPIRQGDFFTVNINDNIYQQSLDEFRDYLIGRIMMSQGDKPYSNFELGKKLHELWGIIGAMDIIPLSRGYYTIHFSSPEDRNRVFRRRHWVLQPGAIRLQNWVQDFNPNKICTSLAQVWVRLLDLPMEYWHPTILEAMASAFGTLIKIDTRTMHKRMGHYVRMLVEIDMKAELVEKVMYKRTGGGLLLC